MADGCKAIGDEIIEGSYEQKSFTSGVRCCKETDDTCETIGACPSDATTYHDAVAKCTAIGRIICTKNQILSGICCQTGGNCDRYPVWTSTFQTDGKFRKR